MRHVLLASAVGEKAIVANAVEARRQHVEQKAPDELLRCQGHRFPLVAISIVGVVETDLPVADAEQAIVRDRDPVRDRIRPDCGWIHRELKRVGVTLQLLWEEYAQAYPDGYRYSQFCEIYRQWARRLRPSMRQVHRAGEKTFIDFSGKKPTIVDWMGTHTRMVDFFGGATALWVPDQLKSAITRPCRYEPGVNRTYEELAAHYGAIVVPARPAKARDKAKVEASVLVAQRWILARLRDQIFFSLAALNAAIRGLLDALNDRPLQRLGVSRRTLYERLDRPALRPLPAARYVVAEWKPCRVNIDYHVEVARHQEVDPEIRTAC